MLRNIIRASWVALMSIKNSGYPAHLPLVLQKPPLLPLKTVRFLRQGVRFVPRKNLFRQLSLVEETVNTNLRSVVQHL
jgi:hypothetical protein